MKFIKNEFLYKPYIVLNTTNNNILNLIENESFQYIDKL